MSHYLKLAMDAVFGKRTTFGMRLFGVIPDRVLLKCVNSTESTVILFYWYSKASDIWVFNRDDIRIPHTNNLKGRIEKGQW